MHLIHNSFSEETYNPMHTSKDSTSTTSTKGSSVESVDKVARKSLQHQEKEEEILSPKLLAWEAACGKHTTERFVSLIPEGKEGESYRKELLDELDKRYQFANDEKALEKLGFTEEQIHLTTIHHHKVNTIIAQILVEKGL